MNLAMELPGSFVLAHKCCKRKTEEEIFFSSKEIF
jgi:hypothetical protein